MAKIAKIVSVRSGDAQGFCWQWQSADGKHRAAAKHGYYYECVEDARKAGYDVELTGTFAKSVDGSDRHGLA